MANKIIKKEIEVNAPAEKVWNVLFSKEGVEDWGSSFSEGTIVDTDWGLNSKIAFKDHSGMGIVGRIVEKELNKLMKYEYDAMLKNGVEDSESPQGQSVKGTYEKYELVEKNGKTKILAEAQMDDSMYEMMSDAWDKAMNRVKELAEK